MHESNMKKSVLIISIFLGTMTMNTWAESSSSKEKVIERTNVKTQPEKQKDVFESPKKDVFASPKADAFADSTPDVFASPKVDKFSEPKKDVFKK